MAWSSDPWSEGVYTGGVIANTAPPGQTVPPAVPGGTTVYTWSLQPGVLPWSYGGWSGAVAPATYIGGGIVLVPQPTTGTMQVLAWWPNTPSLLLTRQVVGYPAHPVRGGWPLPVVGATRTNLATNPNVRAGLTGYTAGTGSPTLSTITRTDITPSDTAWRATIAAAGTDEVVIPQALPGGQLVTIGIDLRFSARPGGLTVTVGWNNAAGGALTASTATLTADQINNSVNQFGRQVVTITPPAGAVVCSSLKVTATGLPAGATMDGSRVMIEQGVTGGSYGDGDVLGGQWTGTAELSTSIIAPVQTLYDGECPLDVPTVYTVWNLAVTGGSAASPPATLASNDQTWLTHPASPASPTTVQPTITPALVRATDRAVFSVLGSPNPIVVTGSVRHSPSGTLVLDCPDWATRDNLLGLLADNSPLLLRAPAAYGMGDGWWCSFGDVAEDPRGAVNLPSRSLSIPFQVVDPPLGANLTMWV